MADEYMCPNCVTPWKCNGPHLTEESTASLLDTLIYYEDAGGETTLREVFKLLLGTLFREADGFSGKRPLGNSDWETSIASALISKKLLYGENEVDADGDILDINFEWADFHEVINKAIEEL